MEALQISKHGVPAEVVQLVDISEPDAPKTNEVLAAVEYAPINQSEQLKIMGRYPLLPASFPAGVGNEGVARILSVGNGVAGLKPGDRVLVPAMYPAWRERILLPAAGLFALPAGADPQQLSMLSINPPTAALLLSEYVDLKPGDWVLQNAGNSGVGRSVIAIAKSRGLLTISLVRRPELVDELTERGADVVLVDGPDIAARVAKASDNAKIRLAIDGIAGESTASLSKCLEPGGTVVLYSFTSGKPGLANGVDLVFRNVTLRGFWLYSPQFLGSAKVVQAIKLGAQLVAEGKLAVPIAATYSLRSAAAALAHAQKGGKVLFEISWLSPGGHRTMAR
ncbi:MAG TPA: zinc-dependent alcohol dehydrogenase family protein [Candidatus Dormibacteraeota bacterium]|nr:zinc-dependent alcohol dehydrogenase family protein [Candidatus Dormibacteraeota bacterium]